MSKICRLKWLRSVFAQGHGHGFLRCAAVADQMFRKNQRLVCVLFGNQSLMQQMFAVVRRQDHCERRLVEEVTLCNRRGCRSHRAMKRVVKQLTCIQHCRIRPISGVVVWRSRFDGLSFRTFVGVWCLVVDMAGMTLACAE